MSVNFFLTKTETLMVGDAGAIFSTICRERKEKIDGKIYLCGCEWIELSYSNLNKIKVKDSKTPGW